LVAIFSKLHSPDLLKSTDKGINWTQITGFNILFDVTPIFEMVYNPITKDIFVNNVTRDFEYYFNVYRSINSGADWKLEDTGLPIYMR